MDAKTIYFLAKHFDVDILLYFKKPNSIKKFSTNINESDIHKSWEESVLERKSFKQRIIDFQRLHSYIFSDFHRKFVAKVHQYEC